jgi:hypothetical protein
MFPLRGFTRAKANQMTRKSHVQVCQMLLFLTCEGQFHQHAKHSLTIEAHQIKHSPEKQVEQSHSQKTPSRFTHQPAKTNAKSTEKKPVKPSNTSQIGDKLISHRSLQTGVEIGKNEREKHTQEAYKRTQSRKELRQQTIFPYHSRR